MRPAPAVRAGGGSTLDDSLRVAGLRPFPCHPHVVKWRQELPCKPRQSTIPPAARACPARRIAGVTGGAGARKSLSRRHRGDQRTAPSRNRIRRCADPVFHTRYTIGRGQATASSPLLKIHPAIKALQKVPSPGTSIAMKIPEGRGAGLRPLLIFLLIGGLP